MGEEVGVLNSTDDIVDELHKIGFIKKIGTTKILTTFEGKKEVEESNWHLLISGYINSPSAAKRLESYFSYLIED